MAAALTVEQLFDSVAIRLNGPKAWSETMTIDWHLTDLGERYRMTLSNGVLVHYPNPGSGDAELSLTLTKPQLLTMLGGGDPDGVAHQGDLGALQRLLTCSRPPLQPSPSSPHRPDRGDCETGNRPESPARRRRPAKTGSPGAWATGTPLEAVSPDKDDDCSLQGPDDRT
jgi:Alkyl sulfatase C-terminal